MLVLRNYYKSGFQQVLNKPLVSMYVNYTGDNIFSFLHNNTQGLLFS